MSLSRFADTLARWFAKGPVMQRVACWCVATFAISAGVLMMTSPPSDDSPGALLPLIGLALFGSWLVGWLASAAALFRRERNPLFSCLLLAFFSYATTFFVGPLG